MSDTTEEHRDAVQRDEQAERIGDAIRDGEIETAVEELADARNYYVHVEGRDRVWSFYGDESNIEAALSAVSKRFDSLHVEIKKHRGDTYVGTGEIPS